MGKHGPCRHCGVTSTPLWRNGPPEKPVLCNACGSRWRTKGSLAHYTPLHARDPIEFEQPMVSKMKSTSFKNKEYKLLKKKQMNGITESEHIMPFLESDQNYIRAFDGNASNRSSSGSAISYSESCANFRATDASDCTGSAQSNSRDSSLVPLPSKKRSVIHPKPSFEKLTKDLYCIWNEQQSTNISGSSEEDLLFELEMPMGSVEIGHGGVLLRYPSYKTTEEESEASSLPVHKKLISDAISRSVSFPVNNESKRTRFSEAGIEKIKISTAHVSEEHAKREIFSPENLNMLKDRDSPLRFNNLEDLLSLEVYMKRMTNDEMQVLMKYIPYIDTANHFESLRSLFSSLLFMENLSYFLQLLQDGIFDLNFSQLTVEECRNLKLVLLNYTKSRCPEHLKELKDIEHRQGSGVQGGEKQDSKQIMRSPKIVYRSSSINCPSTKSSILNATAIETNKMVDSEDFMNNDGTCFSPRSLFTWTPDHTSEQQYSDDSTDQELLLDVRCSSSFPEAELLHHNHPWKEKAASYSSQAGSSIAAADEESLTNFPASSFSNQQLNQH